MTMCGGRTVYRLVLTRWKSLMIGEDGEDGEDVYEAERLADLCG